MKKLLGLEETPPQHRSAPSHESCGIAQVSAATHRSSNDYFTMLGKLQEAISKHDYERAAGLVRENVRQVSAFVRSTQREYGSFDISSIPAFEQGGTMLALVGDIEGLTEMREIVRSIPQLDPWRPVVEQHEEDRSLFGAIMMAIEKSPECLQTDLKELVGAKDGHRIANLVSWLEKAGKISRTKKGRKYILTLCSTVPVPVPALKREVRSHRIDSNRPPLREICLEDLAYIPLPRAPLKWEQVREGHLSDSIKETSELFEVRGGEGWKLLSVEKFRVDERPDAAFRQIHLINSGLIMIDDLGKSEKAKSAPAAALRFGRSGDLKAEGSLHNDIYRLGVNAFGHGLIAMSKDCVAHAYDDEFRPILETPLREAPEIRALQQRFGIDADKLKNYIRCVALAHDNSRYVFTGVDEAWCVDMDGHGLWGVRLPKKEGWVRVAETSLASGTSADVMRALEVMKLTLPVTPEDIKRRYREFAKQWHPDLNPGDQGAEERMKALTGAAEILTGINPAAMPRYSGATFMKEMHRETFDVEGLKLTISMGMQVSEVHAADWIYAANFTGRSHGVFLAAYSGRIVQVDEDGRPVCAYDIGAVPRRIIDTGDYLYFLTDTRLYVLRGEALHSIVDIFDGGDLLIAQTGFGLLERKCFRWFHEDGTYLGMVVTKSPIRRVYYSREGMVVETREHKALIGGVNNWWE
ncbi:MAG: J domain-containing protein [Nitrospiraceae bacterium]